VYIQSAGRFGLNVVNAVRGVDINTTSSDGVLVRNAGQHGLYVLSAAENGLQIDQAGTNGVEVVQTVADGFHIQNAGRDGIRVGNAGQFGVGIANATTNGLQVDQAGTDGVLINSAGRFGLNVANALRGVDINTTSSHGVVVRSAGQHGLYVLSATANGLQVDQASTNGVQVNQATFDGIQIQNAGRDGIRVSSAGAAAGQFFGNVNVTGTLSKGGGSFKIDHPLDPANKYLAHSFVESPDMMNVYNGNAVLDAAGEAVVTLPAYFEMLNRDFRYQLTAIGAPGPNLYIAEKISGNQFRIAGGTPGMEVSWQVTGIRQDAWAEENRIVVEQDKKPEARGFYLHPRLYGQPETRSMVRQEDDF